MDPYAAQWAQYGYAISTPDPSAAAAYNYAYQNYAGVQQTNNTAVAQQTGGAAKNQRPQRPQTVTHIPTHSQPPVATTAPPSWNNTNVLPPTTYMPTKTFIKAGTNENPKVTAGEVYDPSNSAMKLHQLAKHNNVIEIYEKVDGVPGTQAVRLKMGTETYTGVGSTFKAAKQDAATKALAETKLQKPPERKTLKPRPLGVTATQELHELATKKGLTVKFKFIEPYNFEFKPTMRLWSKEEMRGNYRVQLQVGTMEFMGHADLPQQAKHNSAVQALPYLHQMPNIKPASKVAAVPAKKSNDLEAAATTPQGKNVIMVLNEIAMSQGVCMDWTMVDEDGPPHMRAFTWTLKMGSYEAVGSGNSKKLAKAIAAQNMYQTIPEEWKNRIVARTPRKKPPMKRKKPMPTAGAAGAGAAAAAATGQTSEVITSTNTTLDHIEIPGEKKIKTEPKPPVVGATNAPAKATAAAAATSPKISTSTTPIYSVIQTANPISALFEYCKKVKYPDPMFECVSENVLETWQKNNHTFKKTEYTMKLEVAGKSYFGSANTKKAAKTAVATEAWNVLRTGTM